MKAMSQSNGGGFLGGGVSEDDEKMCVEFGDDNYCYSMQTWKWNEDFAE